MKASNLAATLAALLALGGCQTNEQYQAEVNASLDDRLNAGQTMAGFMSNTSMMPSTYYPVSEGRVFVFQGPSVYMTLPATSVTPAVTRSSACQLLIRAVPNGAGGNADGWTIKGTQRSGPCNNLPV